MYYYTGRLTDKSDVFSFGVLLVELITRKKPFVYRSDDDDSLVSYFASLLTKGNLVEIVDPQVMEEDSGEVQVVAALAVMCTKLDGEDRTTMREVEMALQNLQARKKPALHNISSKIYDEDQIAAHYKTVEDLLSGNDLSVEGGTEGTSRLHTMGDEILLEAGLPR
uniref:Serine-threonine/tyrosine-protein kinase catalytic domain-containing protein n=1 Tax=Arundo donax TaxID=35708 RepID=A0A0A9BND4_ARUDO